jgi:hypothetical protein
MADVMVIRTDQRGPGSIIQAIVRSDTSADILSFDTDLERFTGSDGLTTAASGRVLDGSTGHHRLIVATIRDGELIATALEARRPLRDHAVAGRRSPAGRRVAGRVGALPPGRGPGSGGGRLPPRRAHRPHS